jgi:hypothetical protein
MNPAASTLLTALAIAAAALPLPADAQSYRCTGKDGKKYYGQSLPPQCIGQPAELLNPQGMVVRRLDPQASAAERAAKEAEAEERKKREAATKEEGRRNRALLATYTSEKDIEDARVRALKDNEAAVKDIERRIGLMKKSQQDTSKELEFYTGKNKPPATLEQKIKNLEFDIQTQEGLLQAKKKEVSAINARYDDDKKRYVELTKGSGK